MITAEQARAAAKALPKGTRVMDFCEPCGDANPKEPRVVESVSVRPWDDGRSKTLQVNGEDVDLAYLFVETHSGSETFANLAVRVGCAATGVSAEVDLKHRSKRSPSSRPVGP